MKKNEIVEAIAEFETKYFELVWYARSTPQKYKGDIKKVATQNKKRIRKKFPDETRSLSRGRNFEFITISSENGHWHHGFNSGCLATARYVLELMEKGMTKEKNKEICFPFLDS